MSDLVTLLLKIPRNTQVTPESAQTFLAALTQVNRVSGIQKLLGKVPPALSLEIALVNQQTGFYITCSQELIPFIETQLQSNYPLVIIEKTKDPLEGITLESASLKLTKGSYYPIATMAQFTDVDPLSSVLSVLSKS